MAKKVKMILYGEPGTGKSVFAGNAPKPFFICTDGNYEWLEGLVPDFNEENHIQIGSYAEFENLLPLLATDKFAKYDTFVLDLIEDLYTWADYELCKKNKVKHISELGDYGKGYDVLRKPFIASILKFIALDKNIIILSHESTKDEKNKRGVVTTKYLPSSVMNIEKVWDKFAGQCQFVIRCYKDYEQDEDSKVVLYRLLNIKNKPEEYGTYRLPDVNAPETIELDWDTFAETIGLNSKVSIYAKATKPQSVVTSDMKADNIGGAAQEETPKKTVVTPKPATRVVVKPSVSPKPVEEVVEEETPVAETEAQVIEEATVEEKPVVEEKPTVAKKVVVKPTPKVQEVETEDLPPKQEVKEEPKKEEPKKEEVKPQPTTQMSMADRIAAIRAKQAEIRAKNNK